MLLITGSSKKKKGDESINWNDSFQMKLKFVNTHQLNIVVEFWKERILKCSFLINFHDCYFASYIEWSESVFAGHEKILKFWSHTFLFTLNWVINDLIKKKKKNLTLKNWKDKQTNDQIDDVLDYISIYQICITWYTDLSTLRNLV